MGVVSLGTMHLPPTLTDTSGWIVERLANRVERVIESTYFRQTPVIADVTGAPAGI